MIVSHRHRFVFVKTRKTAGSSIEAALFPFLGPDDICTGSERDGTPRRNCPAGTSGHLGWRAIRNLAEAQGYYWFAFERNPWDKTVSDWLFKREVAGRWCGSLREFVNRGCPVDWPKYSDDEEPVVDVHRYEDLQGSFGAVMRRIGIPLGRLDLHLKRYHGRRPYREYFDADTRTAVARCFPREIAHFGYTF